MTVQLPSALSSDCAGFGVRPSCRHGFYAASPSSAYHALLYNDAARKAVLVLFDGEDWRSGRPTVPMSGSWGVGVVILGGGLALPNAVPRTVTREMPKSHLQRARRGSRTSVRQGLCHFGRTFSGLGLTSTKLAQDRPHRVELPRPVRGKCSNISPSSNFQAVSQLASKVRCGGDQIGTLCVCVC